MWGSNINTYTFPEIAKAVGAHKYVRRVAVPGGGYRYVYKEPAPRVHGASFGRVHSQVSESIRVAAAHGERGERKSAMSAIARAMTTIDKWERGQTSMIREAGQKKRSIGARRGIRAPEQRAKAIERLREQARELRAFVVQAQRKITRGQFIGARKLAPTLTGLT